MSQEAFADKCGFVRSYMSRIERGVANPSLDAVEVLAVALNVPVAGLFDDGTSEAAKHPLLVPYASDGTCFHPGLRRPQANTYSVGEKGHGNTLYFTNFDDALAHLRQMKPAKWWRPNSRGNWGLVTAIRWAPLTTLTSEPATQA